VSAVLAIDAGTTGVRAMAVDETGEVIGRSYREFGQHFPRPGWVEHDPDEIWAVTQEVLAEVVATLDVPVAAIGITDQRETVVAWSRSTGRPLHRAIVWQDRRTTARCEQLVADGHLPRIRELTGLVADPYFSGSKMQWLLTEGGVSADDADLALGTIDSWLLWKLTDGAVFATDPSNASRTMLFDITAGQWSDELCDLFGVPANALAEVRPSCGRFGATASTCVAGGGIPVSGIAGDQQSALFGQCCTRPGMAKNTYGTGSFVLMNVGASCPPPTEGLLTTVAWEVPARILGGSRGDGNPTNVTHYALEGAIFVTGALVQWLRDGLGIIEDAAETGPLAESVPDAGGVVIVPAFTGLGAPWWDPNARGTILGLSRGSTRAHLARAAVESMVFQTRDVVDAMTAASGQTIAELRVDGGASVMSLLLRLQADQLGVRVARPSVTETTALGAAHLAGLAEGVWSDVDEVAAAWQRDVEVEPGGDRGTLDAAHAQWRRGVERSRAWVSA
jgi:glycerol kinase